MRQRTDWMIVCSTMNARGTAKIANDYLAFFGELGVEARIVSPRFSTSRVYALLWELAAVYMWRIERGGKIVLVNGRISPLLRMKRVDILLVTLDLMNYGWSALFSRELSGREKVNVVVNTLLVPGSQIKARWRSVISTKTRNDLLCLDKEKDLRLTSPCVIYPSGSFTSMSEDRWNGWERDEQELKRNGDYLARAIWITGETKNKGFVKATKILSELSIFGTKLHIDIFGIQSQRMRTSYEESVSIESGLQSVFRTKVSERELIELYVRTNIALCLSEEEGFGLPFMDAILFGLPIIARRIDTYMEICELTSEEGIELPPILWLDKSSRSEERGAGARLEGLGQELILEAKSFIRRQEARIDKEDRSKRKRAYRDKASRLLERSSRELAKLIGSGGCT